MSFEAACRITITLSNDQAHSFASLLQEGFFCLISADISIRDFLLGLPGFSGEYIEKTVQTIFHNGVAADSLQTPLRAGDKLALSAAMPGLAGAIFRREGMHASLRSKVQECARTTSGQAGFVLVKLYNQIGADRVLDVMQPGVRMASSALVRFIERRSDLFHGKMRMFHDGTEVSTQELLGLLAACQQVELSLHTQD